MKKCRLVHGSRTYSVADSVMEQINELRDKLVLFADLWPGHYVRDILDILAEKADNLIDEFSQATVQPLDMEASELPTTEFRCEFEPKED